MSKQNKVVNEEKMCECEKRIDNLKEVMKYVLNQVHDLIASTTDESKDFYEGMSDEFDKYTDMIEAI